jgi:hypothetical protein
MTDLFWPVLAAALAAAVWFLWAALLHLTSDAAELRRENSRLRHEVGAANERARRAPLRLVRKGER